MTVSSSFEKDLGLDSLDAVEVMMAVEEVRDTDDLVPIPYELTNFRNSPLKYLMPRRTTFTQLNKVCIAHFMPGRTIF